MTQTEREKIEFSIKRSQAQQELHRFRQGTAADFKALREAIGEEEPAPRGEAKPGHAPDRRDDDGPKSHGRQCVESMVEHIDEQMPVMDDEDLKALYAAVREQFAEFAAKKYPDLKL